MKALRLLAICLVPLLLGADKSKRVEYQVTSIVLPNIKYTFDGTFPEENKATIGTIRGVEAASKTTFTFAKLQR